MSGLFVGFNGDEDVYLIRYNPGRFRDGEFSGTRAFRRRLKDFSIQPVQTSDVELLVDGLTRAKSMIKLFTTDEVIAGNPDKGIQADELEVNGSLYAVDSVNAFLFGDDLDHYEAIAVKVAQ